MNPFIIGTIVFLCVFGGALAGMLLQGIVPEEHLSPDAKDVVKLGMGLIATMTALILGLVTASAKASFDTQDNAVKNSAATILQLDRVLAQYGPETQDIRVGLKQLITRRLRVTWPEDSDSNAPMKLDAPELTMTVEALANKVRLLTPTNEAQHYLQAQALEMASELQQTRWHILGGISSSVQTPFITIIVFWLAIIFGSFGLFAPRNGTVVAVLFVCALSVATSLFLILELDDPFHGMMKVSSVPLVYTLEHMGQ